MPLKGRPAVYQTIIEKPYLYHSYVEAALEWDIGRWPNFSPEELACPLTGQLYLDPDAIDKLQSARRISEHPFVINSAHRSPEHNKAVGGAPNSAHLQIAFDISLNSTGKRRHNRYELRDWLFHAGFTRFGLYESFIHVDTRPRRATWYGPNAKELWNRHQPLM